MTATLEVSARGVTRCPVAAQHVDRGVLHVHDPGLVRSLADEERLSGADAPSQDVAAAATSTGVRTLLAEVDAFYDAWPMFLEGDAHRRTRRALDVLLGADRAATLRERMIEHARACADRIGPGHQDLRVTFVEPFVAGVVAAVLDVDAAVVGRLAVHAAVLGDFLFGRDDGRVTPTELAMVVRASRSVQELVAAEMRGGTWDRVRLHERDPRRVAALVTQVTTGALEPLGLQVGLRLAGVASDDGPLVPFRILTRTALEPLTVDGRAVGVADPVHLFLDGPAAHRLRYGAGRHRCAGVSVAEQATRAAEQEVGRRLVELGSVVDRVQVRRTYDACRLTGLTAEPRDRSDDVIDQDEGNTR